MTDTADALRYTPYDGSKQPFSIGLVPLDLTRWIEPDSHLHRDLAEKDALFAAKRDVVWRAEPGTEAAQQEVLDLIAAHLQADHQRLVTRAGDVLRFSGSPRAVNIADEAIPALHRAARLVQDDLVLMRQSPRGWRLVAASLCFPSAWSLAEKFTLPMDDIHAHVPGYADRMGARITRIFDNLKVELPVWRLNWSIYDDAKLHHPESKQGPRAWSGAGGSFGDTAFIRVERQTLRKLPASGDILFTIRVYHDPVSAFHAHPNGAALAAGLRAQLLGLDPDQLRYKGMLQDRDRVAEALAAMASSP
jgi:hypothetical protein